MFGYSTLALLVAMSDTNGGMFMALTSVMGDKEDAGTYVPQSIETGPFLTMVILVGAGLANIPWLTIVSVIAPIAVGALLGNLDEDLREFFGSHEPIIVPFMGFTLGQTINLSAVVTAGIPGVDAGRVRAGRHRRGVHPRRSAARRLRHRRRRGVDHRRQFRRGAEGGRHGRPDLCCRSHRSRRCRWRLRSSLPPVLTPLLTSFVYRRVQRQRALEAQAAPAVMPLAAAPGDD